MKMAECYKLMGEDDQTLALYRKISTSEDPFWRKIALEKIKASKFEREISKKIGKGS